MFTYNKLYKNVSYSEAILEAEIPAPVSMPTSCFQSSFHVFIGCFNPSTNSSRRDTALFTCSCNISNGPTQSRGCRLRSCLRIHQVGGASLDSTLVQLNKAETRANPSTLPLLD